MPFASTSQRSYLFANNPKVAREFAAATPKGAKLPKHIRKDATTALRDRMKARGVSVR